MLFDGLQFESTKHISEIMEVNGKLDRGLMPRSGLLTSEKDEEYHSNGTQMSTILLKNGISLNGNVYGTKWISSGSNGSKTEASIVKCHFLGEKCPPRVFGLPIWHLAPEHTLAFTHTLTPHTSFFTFSSVITS